MLDLELLTLSRFWYPWLYPRLPLIHSRRVRCILNIRTKLTSEEAHARHQDIVDRAIPKRDVQMIDYVHAWADGVRTGWFESGVISESELNSMRKELREAVTKRKGDHSLWSSLFSRLWR